MRVGLGGGFQSKTDYTLYTGMLCRPAKGIFKSTIGISWVEGWENGRNNSNVGIFKGLMKYPVRPSTDDVLLNNFKKFLNEKRELKTLGR